LEALRIPLTPLIRQYSREALRKEDHKVEDECVPPCKAKEKGYPEIADSSEGYVCIEHASTSIGRGADLGEQAGNPPEQVKQKRYYPEYTLSEKLIH
jgi:hypothetical protein